MLISALAGTISIKDVCSLGCATSDFLIPADRNVYDIEFTRFILRNMENNQKLIDVGQPTEKPHPQKTDDEARFETVLNSITYPIIINNILFAIRGVDPR